MAVLVTGAAGFIGSHVAEHLQQSGHLVVGLDDLSGGLRDHIPPGIEFVVGDIADAPLVDRLFAAHQFEVVYHLAAYAAEGLSPFIRRFNYANNVVGSMTLLNAALNHGTRRFVFTSSIAVYGAGQPPMTEATPPRPLDPYGIAKLAVEMDLAAAADLFDIEYVIFRPHNVYGERQSLTDRYRNVIGIFLRCLIEDRPLPIFGDGRQTRAFSYIGDVAPTIARGGFEAGAKNETFNVGADTPTAILDLAEQLSRLFDRPARFDFQPARHEVQHAFSSHERVRLVFGPLTTTPLSDGLARMTAWARRAGPALVARGAPAPPPEPEVRRKLPPSWAS